jgi:hypothetical protein
MAVNFEPILDAYQLTEGAIVKGKEQEELFQLGEYDADKKGYTAYPYENGERFGDFSVLITENELMDNYLVEPRRDEADGEQATESDTFPDIL